MRKRTERDTNTFTRAVSRGRGVGGLAKKKDLAGARLFLLSSLTRSVVFCSFESGLTLVLMRVVVVYQQRIRRTAVFLLLPFFFLSFNDFSACFSNSAPPSGPSFISAFSSAREHGFRDRASYSHCCEERTLSSLLTRQFSRQKKKKAAGAVHGHGGIFLGCLS